MIGPRIKWTAIILLLGLLGTLGWLYRAEIKHSAQLAQTVVQQRATLGDMETELQQTTKRLQRARSVAARHKREMDQLQKQSRELRNDIRKLAKQNPKVRRWADSDLPGPVLDRLHHQNDHKD